MVDDGRRTTDDGRTDDGRTDGRTTEHGYTISSPCEPDGSGELKIAIFEGVLDFNLQPLPLAWTQGPDAME